MKQLIILLSLSFLVLSSCSKKPEDVLTSRIEAVDTIMKDNMDNPAKGVDELIAYFEKNGPDTAKLIVEAGIELSNIEGKGDREKRLKEINDKLKTAWKNLDDTGEKFSKKVQKDESAREKAKEYFEKWQDLGQSMSQIIR